MGARQQGFWLIAPLPLAHRDYLEHRRAPFQTLRWRVMARLLPIGTTRSRPAHAKEQLLRVLPSLLATQLPSRPSRSVSPRRPHPTASRVLL